MTYVQDGLLDAAAVTFARRSMAEANDLLTTWGHYLGPCERLYGPQGWVLAIEGRAVAVAVSGAPVSSTVAGLPRTEVVELARLCAAPGERWATRPTLRLWREIAAPRWPYWTVRAASAYSQNSRHDGSIYRFDGWTKVTDKAGSAGGGTWSAKRLPGDVLHGRKTLWLWTYEGSPDAGE